jgi:hypothetical protein
MPAAVVRRRSTFHLGVTAIGCKSPISAMLSARDSISPRAFRNRLPTTMLATMADDGAQSRGGGSVRPQNELAKQNHGGMSKRLYSHETPHNVVRERGKPRGQAVIRVRLVVPVASSSGASWKLAGRRAAVRLPPTSFGVSPPQSGTGAAGRASDAGSSRWSQG